MFKKSLQIINLGLLLALGTILINPSTAQAYNFGDFKSSTLVSKAWGALAQNDIEGVLAYTNKCIELYGEEAQKMQKSVEGYIEGDNDAVFANWALNDVSTALFIQGEVYRNAEMEEEAKQAYRTLVTVYTYGQAWDPKGWFWKPAEAAKEKLHMLETGSSIDFGNYSSSHLVGQAWKALNQSSEDVVVYVDKVLELYGEQAKEMQDSLTEYPWESQDEIFNYWALNDVGTALYVKGEYYKKVGEMANAKVAYQNLVDSFYFAQTWDTSGWFWKPAEVAQQELDNLGEI